MPRTAIFAIFLIVIFAQQALAAVPGFDAAPAQPVAARAVADQSLVPAGGTARVAVEISVNSRYHIQSAFAPKPYIAAKVTVKPADGLTFGEVQYEKATEIPSPPALGTGMLSVYERKAYIVVPVKVAADAAAGPREVEISLITQACDDTTCLSPKTLHLKVTVNVGKAGEAAVAANGELFDAVAKLEFAPAPAAETAPAATASAPATGAAASAGPGHAVLLLSNDEQEALISSRPYAPRNAGEEEHSLAAILLFALVGGLILNVMPCVLPVIPLKALSFIQQAHGSSRVAMLHALTFSAGVVALFVVLGAALRTLGLFYGQQFQSPAFLITMTLFVVALSLSMLGVWTINPPQVVYELDARVSAAGTPDLHYAGPGTHQGNGAAHPYVSSFGSGIMATLLATPCSAPFLGPVFAFALTRSTWLAAAMLAVVGVGMSLPYVVLALFPQLLNRIPRAGRWSELVKQGLGIIMLGVAFYLLTRIPNTQLWPWALAGVVATGLVCWAWGQIPSPLMERGSIWTIRGVTLAVGILMGLGIWWAAAKTADARPVTNPSGTVVLADKADGQWLPFNVALLDEALKDGRPVVVDWTADWCINCRVLEAAVLDRDETRQAMLAHNAVLLRADLSEDNPPASAFNKKLGGEAIPVLAIFSPTEPNRPVVLRDKYSVARVVQELATP